VWHVYYKVLLPQLKPAMATLAVLRSRTPCALALELLARLLAGETPAHIPLLPEPSAGHRRTLRW